MPELNELQRELRRLAAERGAIILAHNYQRPEVQVAADHTGDSLELARIAQKDEHSVILFCGVHFMAETAYILSPRKTVLMPDKRAGCPMADMVTVAGLRKPGDVLPRLVKEARRGICLHSTLPGEDKPAGNVQYTTRLVRHVNRCTMYPKRG